MKAFLEALKRQLGNRSASAISLSGQCFFQKARLISALSPLRSRLLAQKSARGGRELLKLRHQKIAILIFLYSLLLISLSNPLLAESEISRECKLKAAFIYNFTKYIQWPSSDKSPTFAIAIIGDSDIITPLKEIAEKKLVNDRKINIRHYQDVSAINTCDILFMSASKKEAEEKLEAKRLDEILEKVKGKNILTISDSKGFAERGVAINFVIVKKKVRFEMNQDAIRRAGLRPSSQLLKLAILVKDENKDKEEEKEE